MWDTMTTIITHEEDLLVVCLLHEEEILGEIHEEILVVVVTRTVTIAMSAAHSLSLPT